MPETHRFHKIVIEHVTGPLQGMSQIVGDSGEMAMEYPLEVGFQGIESPPHEGPFDAGLVRMKRGAAYYRELEPSAGYAHRFEKDQE